MTYPDGTEIQVGDFVLMDGRMTPGTVYELIESSEQMERCRVDMPGILVDAIPDGLVFLPSASLRDDPIVFVSRTRARSIS